MSTTERKTVYERLRRYSLVPERSLEEVFEETLKEFLSRNGVESENCIGRAPTDPRAETSFKFNRNETLDSRSLEGDNGAITTDEGTNKILFDCSGSFGGETNESKQEDELEFDLIDPVDNQQKESRSSDSIGSSNSLSNFLTTDSSTQFDELLLQNLVERGLLNGWQAEKLLAGVSVFRLGGYKIVDFLGKGGCGHVFLGRDPAILNNTGKTGVKYKGDVAIKVLPISRTSPERVGLFLREFEIASRLEHPNVLHCQSVANQRSIYYSISDYVNGGDARGLLARYLQRDEKMNYRVACYIIYEAARGLDYLHSRGMVHRDVKLGNVLLMKSGEVLIGDFGMTVAIKNFRPNEFYSPLGKYIEQWEKENSVLYFGSYDERIKRKNQPQGTPDYLDPDQIDDPKYPKPSWDVYSLGVSLYFLLTGIVPYKARNTRDVIKAHQKGAPPLEPLELAPSIPRELSDITMAMLRKSQSCAPIVTMSETIRVLRKWIEPDEITQFKGFNLTNSDNFWAEDKLKRCFVERPYKLSASTASSSYNARSNRETKGSASDESTSVKSLSESISNLINGLDRKSKTREDRSFESRRSSEESRNAFGKSKSISSVQASPSSESRVVESPSPSSKARKTGNSAGKEKNRPSSSKLRIRTLTRAIEKREKLARTLTVWILFPLLALILLLAVVLIVKISLKSF